MDKSMYRNVLVPIDGSETAHQGLTQAIKLAKSLGSRIRVVYVITEVPLTTGQIPQSAVEGIIERLRDEAIAIVARAESEARAEAVEVDTRLLAPWRGRPGDHIIQEAKDWPADLIVCGTHGRRGLRRMILGSDAEYIVRHSPVPVLLVRGPRTDA